MGATSKVMQGISEDDVSIRAPVMGATLVERRIGGDQVFQSAPP